MLSGVFLHQHKSVNLFPVGNEPSQDTHHDCENSVTFSPYRQALPGRPTIMLVLPLVAANPRC